MPFSEGILSATILIGDGTLTAAGTAGVITGYLGAGDDPGRSQGQDLCQSAPNYGSQGEKNKATAKQEDELCNQHGNRFRRIEINFARRKF